VRALQRVSVSVAVSSARSDSVSVCELVIVFVQVWCRAPSQKVVNGSASLVYLLGIFGSTGLSTMSDCVAIDLCNSKSIQSQFFAERN
jgi:hypothetical protein